MSAPAPLPTDPGGLPATPVGLGKLSRPWAIAAIYALFASAWIYLSDRAIGSLATDPTELLAWSVYKGMAFVGVTSLLLFFLIRRALLQLEETNRRLEQEIGEHTLAQEKLEQSARLLRIAGRAAKLGGWAFNPADGSVSWTDEICAIHDVPPGHTPTLGEVIGYFRPEDQEEVNRLTVECAERGSPFDFELPITTAKGHQRWIRVIGEAARDDDGGIIAIQGAMRDISDRKQMEQRILRAHRMESIATLTGGMAHDLSNVLAPIILLIPFLKEKATDEATLDMLSTIESCAQRGTEMVKQVLSFGQGIDHVRIHTDLSRILADLEKVVRETFPASVALKTEFPDGLWGLEGDATQIHQVFLNLFVNARDAMPDGGKLSVIAENVEIDDHYAAIAGEGKAGRYVRVSVTDTGTGMSPEVLTRIFEPLFTTKSIGKGTGMGIPTLAAIVESHGGFLTVYSEPEEGTVFRVHFPATDEDGKPLFVVPESDFWVGHDELILVVDDEAAVRSISRQTLEAYGYRVLAAADGNSALTIFRSRSADVALVLTDMIMPKMDGTALIRALRKIDPEVRIVAASGLGEEGVSRRTADAGARHFLPKPYTAESLLDMIHTALTESEPASTSV